MLSFGFLHVSRVLVATGRLSSTWSRGRSGVRMALSLSGSVWGVFLLRKVMWLVCALWVFVFASGASIYLDLFVRMCSSASGEMSLAHWLCVPFLGISPLAFGVTLFCVPYDKRYVPTGVSVVALCAHVLVILVGKHVSYGALYDGWDALSLGLAVVFGFYYVVPVLAVLSAAISAKLCHDDVGTIR